MYNVPDPLAEAKSYFTVSLKLGLLTADNAASHE